MLKGNYPDFRISHTVTENVDTTQFKLHNHDNSYEMYIFLDGCSDYMVEGTLYPLQKYDIIIMNSNEFHQIIHKDRVRYERLVLEFHSSFFAKNDCRKYRHIFTSRQIGTKNKIPSSYVKQSGALDIIKRILAYMEEDVEGNGVVISCATIELLHILNKYDSYGEDISQDLKVAPIIRYINNNLGQQISIDELSEMFYINKFYLCRIFKKHTGLTVNQYITNKRMVRVKDLCTKGMSLSDACSLSGFSNYSNFYRMYVREFGEPPSKGLK